MAAIQSLLLAYRGVVISPLVDTAYNPDANSSPFTLVIQSDGKAVIGGFFTTVAGVARHHIARINTDGTLDAGYDPNLNSDVFAIAIQSDGKAVVGGYFTTVGGATREKIARTNTDGTVDAGYAASIEPNSDPEGPETFVRSIARGPSNKTMVGGFFQAVNGGAITSNLVILTSSGSTEVQFNSFANNNPNNLVLASAFQSDGRAIFGGVFTSVGNLFRNYIARTNPGAGTYIDAGYNPDANNWVFAIAIQSDGKAIIVGSFTTVGGVTRSRIARLNTDGTLDTAYNPNVNGFVNAIALQSDGKSIIGGSFTTVGGVARNRIARINTDGTLDTTYDPDASQLVRAIAIQSDGKAVIGGDFTTVGGVTRNRIARLLPALP